MKIFNLLGWVIGLISMNGLMFGLKFTAEEMKAQLEESLSGHKKAVDDVNKAHKDLDGKIAEMEKKLKDFGDADITDKEGFKQLEQKAIDAEKIVSDLVKKLEVSPFGGGAVQKSVGQMASESEFAKKYTGGSVDLAEFKGSLFAKDITSDAASAGVLTQPHRVSGIAYDPESPLTVRDLLMTLPISENSIQWLQEKVFTNNAGPQAAEGDAKNQSNITFEEKTSAVKTLAHWLPVSRQILADAPSLRAFIDLRLRQGMKRHEETQLLLGDGTNGNLLGLIPQATAYDTNLSKSGDTKIDQLRRAILQVSIAGYPTTGMTMSPQDWCDIELAKDGNNNYLFTNPVNGVGARLWGKPVAEGFSMTAGQFLLGAFNEAATIWDRELVNVRAAEQHADFFVRNMVAILLEERLALTVEKPAALVKGTLTVTA